MNKNYVEIMLKMCKKWKQLWLKLSDYVQNNNTMSLIVVSTKKKKKKWNHKCTENLKGEL